MKKFRDAVQTNPELRKRPELEMLGKTLLKEPLDFFQRLRDQLQADQGTRPDVLIKLAGANVELGRTNAEIGSFPNASRSYSEAINILESLVHDHPAVPEYQDELARAHGMLGLLLQSMGRPPDALKAMQRSQEIRERLGAARTPAIPSSKVSSLSYARRSVSSCPPRTVRPRPWHSINKR